MRKITFYCDRCGKLIEQEVHQIGTRFLDSEGLEMDHEYGAELCPSCFREIDDMVAFMVRNPTIHFDGGKQIVPKDPKKQNNRTKLDIGKIGALLRAGWSIAKIADEMGVSSQTIANHKEEALALLAKQDLAEAIENDIQEVLNERRKVHLSRTEETARKGQEQPRQQSLLQLRGPDDHRRNRS